MEFNINDLITQGSISAVIAGFAYKAVTRLYSDMREDSTKREEKLMAHLDKVSDTLEKIDERLCDLESKI